MKQKPSLNIVGDQIGSPTWARGLAQVCWMAIHHRLTGVLHWTDAGVASWFDFAAAIQRFGLDLDLLESAIPLTSIPSAEYPTPATRPSYSVLDKSETLALLPSLKFVHWQDQLSSMIEEFSDEMKRP